MQIEMFEKRTYLKQISNYALPYNPFIFSKYSFYCKNYQDKQQTNAPDLTIP